MTKFNKTHLYCLLGGLVLGLIVGFFVGKGMYQTTDSIKVKRDTLILHDTIPDFNPTPKDSATIKYITKWFPKVTHDTVSEIEIVEHHDTVQVEIPITSKHYNATAYDVWVSGYEPSLDSIKVYQEKQYITEIREITKSTKPKRFGLGVFAGYNYNFATKKFEPCVGLGGSFNLVTF